MQLGPTRVHRSVLHRVERFGIPEREHDVADDREQQPDREPVVHERRALPPRVGERAVPLRGSTRSSASRRSTAPMNVAFSFWPGLNLPSCASPRRRLDHHCRSSRVQRLSRPRSARSCPPARNEIATSTGTGSSRPAYRWMVRMSSRRPTSCDSGPAYMLNPVNNRISISVAVHQCAYRSTRSNRGKGACGGGAFMSARRRGRCCGRPNRRRRTRCSPSSPARRVR